MSALTANRARLAVSAGTLVVLVLAVLALFVSNQATKNRITNIENNFSAGGPVFDPWHSLPIQRVTNRADPDVDRPSVQVGDLVVVEAEKCLKALPDGSAPTVSIISRGAELRFVEPRLWPTRPARPQIEGVYRPERLQQNEAGAWCTIAGPDNPFRNELTPQDLALACEVLRRGEHVVATYGASETPIPPENERPIDGVWTTQEFEIVDRENACNEVPSVNLPLDRQAPQS